MSSCEPPKIHRHVVDNIGLVHILSEVYGLTVHCKRDACHCWSSCQVALQYLIEKILPLARCILGHWVECKVHLEQVVQGDDALEYTGEYGELRIFCSDDFVPQRKSNSFQNQDDPERREHYEECRRVN